MNGHDDYPLRAERIKIEVERLMMPYFDNSSYDFCRWLLRYNEKIKGRPLDLYEENRASEVLALAKALVKHRKFLSKAEKESRLI
jgi:hypothetical protein